VRKLIAGLLLVPLAMTLWAALIYLVPLSDPSGNTELNVVSYNVHLFMNLQNRDTFEEILGGLSRAAPDLLLLQEFPAASSGMDPPRILRKRLELPYWRFFPYHGSSVAGLAVFSRHPILADWEQALPPQSEGRSLGVVRVDVGGRPLNVAVLHLSNSDIRLHGARATMRGELFGENIRTVQTEAVLESLDSLSSEPLILGGDFNTFSFSKAWRRFRRSYNDAFPFWRMFDGTFRFRQEIQVKIDHIFLSRDVKALDAQVLPVQGSDHLPVYARVVF